MAKLRKTRDAQYPLIAEFVFKFDDTMVDVAGVEKTFGSVFGDAGTFEIIPLPVGAVVCGGEVIVEEQGVGPTAYTLSIGDADSATAYANAVDLLAAAGTRTALTLAGTQLRSNSTGKNIRAKIASTVANATAGKARVRVMYTIDNRANEVTIN